MSVNVARIILIAFGIFIIFGFAVLEFFVKAGAAAGMTKKYLDIGGIIFKVEIADTIRLRERGLSGRERMGLNEGMYFTFPLKATYGFWMKNMKFPIDIVWIRDEVIAGFEKNVQPEPGTPFYKLKIFYPSERINRVLEVQAGTVDRYGWKLGDMVKFE